MRDFLITLHAYGTWMPDRPQGSFHWQRGYQPPDEALADAYRANQRESSAQFDAKAQRVLIEATLESAPFKALTIHAVATDDTHLHILCGWDDDRSPAHVRDRLKHGLTRRLNERVCRRSWFTKGGHEKPVVDEGHFAYLLDEYLLSHRGVRWDARDGWC